MAAQAGILNATLFGLYIDTGSGSYKVAHSTNTSIQINAEMMGATTKDSNGWDESLPGKKSWTASGDFFYDQSTGLLYGIGNVWTALTAGTKVTCLFKLSNQVDGDIQYSGYAYIESIDISAGVEDNMSYSVSLKGTGAITRTIYAP